MAPQVLSREFRPNRTGGRNELSRGLLWKSSGIAMHGIVNGGGSMRWGMGWGGLVVTVLVVLGVAALAKYLLFNKK